MSPSKHPAVDPVGRALLDGLRRRYSVSSMSILEYVFAVDRPCTLSEIVDATGLRPNTVSSFLTREARKGILEPVGRGVYQRSPRIRGVSQLNDEDEELDDPELSLPPNMRGSVVAQRITNEPGSPLPPAMRNFKLSSDS